MRTLVIADVHGHLDRLEALLLQEGVIGDCSECGGIGDNGQLSSHAFCEPCDGTGLARLDRNVEVIQLGDLGHFGETWTADELCYKFAPEWVDQILWGNHDRAVVANKEHAFGGYQHPAPGVKERMLELQKEGKLKLAYEAHGFLLTHAGLHGVFRHNESPEGTKDDPRKFADWMNKCDLQTDLTVPCKSFVAIRDAISSSRNGPSTAGGILWRDASESLYRNFRQVFGHSKAEKVRTYQGPVGDSYCIDVGDQYNGRLIGIWLPEERTVEVKLEGSYH